VGIQEVGKYRIIRRIGRGATANVYGAFQQDLNRMVAVKMLNHSLAYDQSFKRRFQEEARTIAALNHPHIVQVYDMEQAYATFFIVMEMLIGKDLRTVQKHSGPLAPTTMVSILRQLSRALRYAHERGVVHRDVKPANCAIDDTGHVKLMDFGLASRVSMGDRRELQGAAIGTPRYISPEAAMGRPVDGRGDIYSLGVMAFELLTGRSPFDVTTSNDYLDAHVNQAPADICSIRTDLPDALVEFVDGTLVKNPDRRLTDWDSIDTLLRDTPQSQAITVDERMVRIRYPRSAAVEVDRATAVLEETFPEGTGVRIAWADLEES